MATLTVRKLDDEVYERLRVQAQANNRSLEAEARHVIEQRVRSTDELVDDLQSFHARMVERHGYVDDSTASIRASRDGE